jgi:predicted nucleic acid-binding protein
MNGNNILLDTNIVLYLLNGEDTLIPLLEEKNLYLSFIKRGVVECQIFKARRYF